MGEREEDQKGGDKRKERQREMKHNEIRNKRAVYVRDKCRQNVCAVKKDKWGDDRGQETQGKDSDADKSMRCFNKKVSVCTTLQYLTIKQSAFFSKSLSLHMAGWTQTT